MTFAPAKLESTIARLEALGESPVREAARELVSAILDFHGQGLRRLFERLRETSGDGERILQTIAQDEVVASLLLLHGLHPLPVEARVRRALGSVRASDPGEGGHVELLSIEDATIRLRATGTERLRRSITRAVEEAAPEAERVEVLLTPIPSPSIVPIERLAGRRKPEHGHCDLCGHSLSSEHEHLFDIEHRGVKCACTACGLLFDTHATKLRRVRRKAIKLENFQINERQWAALEVPVGLAFFSYSSFIDAIIAGYPAPAGAIESVVSKPAWDDLVKDNPALTELEPDTSALVVDRLSATPTYHILSIDDCYRLTATVRSFWQGPTGGDGPLHAVKEFFAGFSEARP